MSTVSKNAILKALIDGVITELMVKTTSNQVYLDENTTLSAKLAEIVAAVNARAKTSDVTAAVDALRQELLGDVPIEAYNTFTELAAYISEHADVSEAITAAIGEKANQSDVNSILQTISALGTLANKSSVSESDLDDDLKNKIVSASQGNHSHNNLEALATVTSDKITAWDQAATNDHTHSNKGVLDGITTGDVSSWNSAGNSAHSHSNKSTLDGINSTKVTNWDKAATDTHTHSNKTTLDGITADDVENWDGKSTVHVSASEPTNLQSGDLWFHTI